MSSTIEPLIVDLVEWVMRRPRAHAEVIEAWRTSCPRLTVWEDAVERGLVQCETGDGTVRVIATTLGRALVERARPPAAPSDCLVPAGETTH